VRGRIHDSRGPLRSGAQDAHRHTVAEARNERRSRTIARAQLARILRLPGSMSQKIVQLVIGWLLTDEDLRLRFRERPRETLVELQEQGYELTQEEIDALVRSDPDVWPLLARRIHPRLQRCSLRARTARAGIKN